MQPGCPVFLGQPALCPSPVVDMGMQIFVTLQDGSVCYQNILQIMHVGSTQCHAHRAENKTIESKRKEMGQSSPLNKSYEHKQNKQIKPKKKKRKEKSKDKKKRKNRAATDKSQEQADRFHYG